MLGSPEHPAITLHFLNAVLGGSPLITDVEILNPIVEKEFEEDKYSILDVRARNESGHRFNIEIQRTKATSRRERLTDPIEQWCYFFRQAGHLTPVEILQRLPDLAFAEATGVLEMIARDPNQRSLYEARVKFERDARANLKQAR